MLEDDPYGELRFEGTDEPRLFALDEGAGNVIYSTSFTKTVAPGIRTGAMVLPPKLHATIRRLAIDTYIGPTMLSEAIVAAVLRGRQLRAAASPACGPPCASAATRWWPRSTATSATAPSTRRPPAATSCG